MTVLAQSPPGVQEAVTAAAARGWEAVVLVVLVLSGFSFFAYMFRQYSSAAQERETRLSARVTHLEDMIREKLFSLIEDNGKLIAQMIEQSTRLVEVCDTLMESMHTFDSVLNNRPCMAMDAVARSKIVESLMQQKANQ
jgi:hypothetical protein